MPPPKHFCLKAPTMAHASCPRVPSWLPVLISVPRDVALTPTLPPKRRMNKTVESLKGSSHLLHTLRKGVWWNMKLESHSWWAEKYIFWRDICLSMIRSPWNKSSLLYVYFVSFALLFSAFLLASEKYRILFGCGFNYGRIKKTHLNRKLFVGMNMIQTSITVHKGLKMQMRWNFQWHELGSSL